MAAVGAMEEAVGRETEEEARGAAAWGAAEREERANEAVGGKGAGRVNPEQGLVGWWRTVGCPGVLVRVRVGMGAVVVVMGPGREGMGQGGCAAGWAGGQGTQRGEEAAGRGLQDVAQGRLAVSPPGQLVSSLMQGRRAGEQGRGRRRGVGD